MANEPRKYKYVVKTGRFFGVGRLPAGTEVELTEAEASGFADLLEPVDRKRRIPLKNELGAEVPEDLKIFKEKTGSAEQPEGMTDKERKDKKAAEGKSTKTPGALGG